MEQLETKDIQGVIIRGYAHFHAACFSVLTITDPSAAKKWIRALSPQVTGGHIKPVDNALHIAFTFDGLKSLGLNKETLNSFPLEFEDGMTTRHKQQFLGDFGTSDPVNWIWGGKTNEPVHILLMMYAPDAQALISFYEKQKSAWTVSGMTELLELKTTVLPARKEHFGFHDGIAQPIIKGLKKTGVEGNTVATGEFILGYKNEYGQYPATPQSGNLDLGKNGSYLVFRQLQQDVESFWRYMDDSTRPTDGERDEKEMLRLASKMLGRWPNGTPLVLSPDNQRPDLKEADNFDYHASDADGMKCPFGAHVRRSNPRYALDTDPRTSVAIANKHRILRRGRSYGTPVAPSMRAEDILKSTDYEGDRGLHFLCFNADIGRQFEFIQNAWINNPKFGGLYDERDPLTGNHHRPEENKTTGTFTIQRPGLRMRYNDVPEFVSVKGGAYFFMPGLKALSHLSSI